MLDAVKRAAAAAGFQADKTAPNTMVLVGRMRPSWCVAAAGLLALPTLGLSLLLLRVKTTSEATATLTDGPRGMHVHLAGALPDYLPSVIEHLLSEQRPLDDTANPRFASSTAPSGFAHARNTGPLAPPQRRAAFAEPPHPDVFNDADVNSTVARPRRIDLTSGAPLLRFDSGVSVTVTGFALIGRAPTAEPGDATAQLLPIADPDLSVSKTHLAVGVDAQGFWVCDRHSTNGSAITEEDGVRIQCVPGQRHYVTSGSTVQVGDRSFSVVFSGISLGRSH